MKIIFFIFMTIFHVQSFSQIKDGSIVYEMRINNHKKILPKDEVMKEVIPEFNSIKIEMLFAANQSIAKREEEMIEAPGQREPSVGPALMMFVGFDGSSDEIYKNYTTGILIEVKDMGSRRFLVEDSIVQFKWDTTNIETKTILSYNCKRASATSLRGEKIVAWYTPLIECPGGPDVYGGLPGMILQLEINGNEMKYTAIEIVKRNGDKLIKAPSRGKKISRKKFEEMLPKGMQPSDRLEIPIENSF